MLAIDDSESMKCCRAGELACMALVTLAQAMSRLDVSSSHGWMALMIVMITHQKRKNNVNTDPHVRKVPSTFRINPNPNYKMMKEEGFILLKYLMVIHPASIKTN